MDKNGEIDKTTSKREIAKLEIDHSLILRERYALFENRARMPVGMLANNETSNLGEAYLAALSALFPESACAILPVLKGKRDNIIQSDFRNRLCESYNPVDAPKDRLCSQKREKYCDVSVT